MMIILTLRMYGSTCVVKMCFGWTGCVGLTKYRFESAATLREHENVLVERVVVLGVETLESRERASGEWASTCVERQAGLVKGLIEEIEQCENKQTVNGRVRVRSGKEGRSKD